MASSAAPVAPSPQAAAAPLRASHDPHAWYGEPISCMGSTSTFFRARSSPCSATTALTRKTTTMRSIMGILPEQCTEVLVMFSNLDPNRQQKL
jgi:hypothetical protein